MLDSIYKILKCNELLSICLSHNTEFSPTYSYRIRETFDSVRHVDCLSQSPVQVARQHEMAICNLFIWRRRSFSVCYHATKSKQKRLCFLRSLEKEMNNFGLVILSHFLAFVRLSFPWNQLQNWIWYYTLLKKVPTFSQGCTTAV